MGLVGPTSVTIRVRTCGNDVPMGGGEFMVALDFTSHDITIVLLIIEIN